MWFTAYEAHLCLLHNYWSFSEKILGNCEIQTSHVPELMVISSNHFFGSSQRIKSQLFIAESQLANIHILEAEIRQCCLIFKMLLRHKCSTSIWPINHLKVRLWFKKRKNRCCILQSNAAKLDHFYWPTAKSYSALKSELHFSHVLHKSLSAKWLHTS